MEKIEQLFGSVIRDLRQAKHISQEGLAGLCELHRTYLSDVERGRRNISLQNIEKISNALHIEISSVFKEVEIRREK